VEVLAPSTVMTMQDWVDTIRKQEDSFQGMGFPKMLNASGKEDLGGGVQVGITVANQDTLLAFAGRTTPAQTGTVTGSPASPVSGRQILQDTAAAFETNGVARGSLVINFTDRSIADVVSVDSENQLTTKTLVNGIGNTYDVADEYQVFNIAQVVAEGGNLTAVDSAGTSISPILPTAFTQVVLTKSSSGTISQIDKQVTNIQYMIESTKIVPGFGAIFYWDPLAGSNSNNAQSPDRAGKTFSYVQSLVVPGRNDIIFIVNQSGAQMIITELVTITKAGLGLRAGGPSTIFRPADDSGDAITVTADCVTLANFRAETTAAGTGRNVISATGANELTCENIFISDSTAAGINISGGDNHKIVGGRIQSCAGNGITILDSIDPKIDRVVLEVNTGWAIELLSTSPSVRTRFAHIVDCVAHHDGPGGLHIGTNTNMTMIRENNYFALASGNDLILDEGSGTHNDLLERGDRISDRTWQRVIEAGFTAEEILRMKAAVDAGNATVPDGDGNFIFRDLGDIKDRVTGTKTGATRTITGRDGS